MGEFELPELPMSANIEGLGIQKIGNKTVVHRGAGAERGIFYWGLLDLEKKHISDVSAVGNGTWYSATTIDKT